MKIGARSNLSILIKVYSLNNGYICHSIIIWSKYESGDNFLTNNCFNASLISILLNIK